MSVHDTYSESRSIVARKDLAALRAIQKFLSEELKTPSYACLWRGVDGLRSVHGQRTDLSLLVSFPSVVETVVAEVQQTIEDLPRGEISTEEYQRLRQHWIPETGKGRRAASCVWDALDMLPDLRSREEVLKRLEEVCLAAEQITAQLQIYFSRIRVGSAAMQTNQPSEDTGPPKRRGVRLGPPQ